MDLFNAKVVVDTSDLDKTEKKLDNVAKTAKKTSTETDKLAGAFSKVKGAVSGGILDSFGGQLGDVRDRIQGVIEGSKGVASSITNVAGGAGRGAAALGALAGGAVAVAGALALVAGGATAVALAVAEAGDKMNDLVNRTNVAAERLSLLSAIAQMSGTTVDELVASSERLGAKLAKQDEESGKAISALKELGVSTKDANGETKNMLQLQEEIVLAVDKAGNSAKAQGIAVSVLGNDYYKLKTAIKDAAENGFENYNRMLNTGALMSSKLTQDSDKLKDTISKIGSPQPLVAVVESKQSPSTLATRLPSRSSRFQPTRSSTASTSPFSRRSTTLLQLFQSATPVSLKR